MDKPEALRLAESAHLGYRIGWQRLAAAELRRLHVDNKLLAGAADILRVAWRDEVHNLMKDKDQLQAHRDALLEALKGITPSMPPADAPCHYGIVPQEKCGHCGRIAKARAAIKAVEGETK